jgi:hypothetical protein
MAESTLSIDYNELSRELTFFLSFGEVPDPNQTPPSDNRLFMDDIINAGVRQFYFPPPLPDGTTHEWSFLKPHTTLTCIAGPTGTHTSDPGTLTTLTDSAANFYVGTNSLGAELVGATITTTDADDSSTTWTNTVSAVASSTTLTCDAFNTNIAVGDAYSMVLVGDYELPDNFGGLVGDIHFEATTGFPPIRVTSVHDIERERMDSGNIVEYRPRKAAVRVRDLPSGTSAGQRYELMLWPVPDSAYVLRYQYVALHSKIDATNIYPLGGMAHAQTIVVSCLAVAERRGPDINSTKYQEQFLQMLAASIAHDRRAYTPETLGYNSDENTSIPISRYSAVTYNDTLY